MKLWTASKLSVVPISLLQRRKTGRSGYGSDVSNVNYLTEPVSNHMPYHRDVGESIQHEVFDSYFHLD